VNGESERAREGGEWEERGRGGKEEEGEKGEAMVGIRTRERKEG